MKTRKKVKLKSADSGKKTDYGWVVKTIIITFVLSVTFSALSSGVLEGVNIWIAVAILLVIISIGILFDMIGVAVTTADETPFHSMAVRKVKGAAQAIALIGARDKVSNFCNDVIGDICGIVSGSASAAIAVYIAAGLRSYMGLAVSLAITGLVAALTVGGKAVGKSISISCCNSIVYAVARLISFFRIGGKQKNKSKRTTD